ncbi:MAG: hypothetical protein L0209_05135 [candidate division Zixibacteria bacterium]|nr:hypothetical protein [candidate division Zixibacteria bacterium]
MIANSRELEKFEKALGRKTKPDPAKNFRIAEALYREAVALGVFPPKNRLEGLEIDIKIARMVNAVSATA